MDKLKLPKLTRALSSSDATVDAENRTMEVSFSSETPVERWFGNEVLSHEKSAADLSRLNDGAPLLFNHDMDSICGVVEKAWIGDDKRGYATVRFARNKLGDEVFSMVEDKILRNISFGYRINSMTQTRSGDDLDTYTADSWSAYEISVVTVPADNSIGIGRAADSEEREVSISDLRSLDAAGAAIPEKETEMAEVNQATAAAAPSVDISIVADEARAQERARINAISALGARFGKADLARQLVESGRSVDEARAAFLEVVGSVQKPVVEGAAEIGLSSSEKREYSLLRAINAQITGDWSKAGFEREVSKEIAKRSGRESAGFFMPMNITMDGQRDASSTAYKATVAGQGGNLVATNLLAGSFIEVLRNKAQIMQLGAQMLSGLVGNVDIPRQTSATATYWVSPEGKDVTESEVAFDKISMTPKTIGTRSQMTRQMLLQSTPDIEMLVRNDLAAVMALGIDLAAITGTGTSGQPTGILNTSGIGSVVGGTNGAAVTIDNLIDLETSITSQNADLSSMAYLTNAKVVGALKKLKATTGQYLWTDYPGGQRSGTPGEINGYAVARSNQIPGNLTKGTGTNLSAILMGDFSQLVIGEWGVLEILANPFGSGFNSGSVDIRALQTVDIAVRNPKSFAAMTDAIA